MKKTLILLLLSFNCFYSYSQCPWEFNCDINLPANLEVIEINSTIESPVSYKDKNIKIGSGNLFKASTTFEDCIVEIGNMMLYENPGKIHFKGCKIVFQEGLTGIRGKNGFTFMPIELVVEDCCINANYTAELMHVQGGSLKFINNVVNAIEPGHIIHLKQLDQTKENSFYGNKIAFHGDPIYNTGIYIDDDFNLGDKTKNKNIISTNSATNIIQQHSPNGYKSINISNTEFCSNSKILEFKSGKIIVDSCVFKNANNAINAQSNIPDGRMEYTIKNSLFENIQQQAIVMNGNKNGSFTILKNTFKDTKEAAIYFPEASSSLNFVQIEGNTFTNNKIDLLSQGGSIGGYTIRRNNFSGKEYGMLMDGDNQFNTENNNFINSYGGAIVNAAGSNTNVHINNQFSSTLIGIQTQGDNNLYQALQNCFSTGAGDLYLDGLVFSKMGNSDVGAGNCFTKNGVPDISAVTNKFDYFIDPFAVNNCFDPVSTGTYEKPIADSRPTSICEGSGTSVTPTVKWNYCYPNKKLTCIEIENHLLGVQNEINLTNNILSISPTNRVSILKYLNACKLRLLKLQLINCRPDVPTPHPDIVNSLRLKDKADLVSIAINDGNYALASTLLDNVNDNSEEAIDFVKIQRINIQRLMLDTAFILPVLDKNTLLQITAKNHPMAGYARGLYYILTGEVILPNIIRHQALENRERSDNRMNVEIFPNPFTDKISIEVSDPNTLYSYAIYDIYGRAVSEVRPQSDHSTIDSNDWPHGIYIIVINSGKENLSTLKLVK